MRTHALVCMLAIMSRVRKVLDVLDVLVYWAVEVEQRLRLRVLSGACAIVLVAIYVAHLDSLF